MLVSNFSHLKLPGGIYLQISNLVLKTHEKPVYRNLIDAYENFQNFQNFQELFNNVDDTKDTKDSNENLNSLTKVNNITSSYSSKLTHASNASGTKSNLNNVSPNLIRSYTANGRQLHEKLPENVNQTIHCAQKPQNNFENVFPPNNRQFHKSNALKNKEKNSEVCYPIKFWELECDIDDSCVSLKSRPFIDSYLLSDFDNVPQEKLTNLEERFSSDLHSKEFETCFINLNKHSNLSIPSETFDWSESNSILNESRLLTYMSSCKNSFQLDGLNFFVIFMFFCFSFLFARCFAQFRSRLSSHLRKFRNSSGPTIPAEPYEALSESELNRLADLYEENMKQLEQMQEIIPTCDRGKLLEIQNTLEEKGYKADPLEMKKIEDNHTLEQIELLVDFFKGNDICIFVRNLNRLSNEVLEFKNTFNYKRKKIDKLLDDIPDANQHWQKDYDIIITETKEMIEEKVLESLKRDYFFTDKINNIFQTRFAQELHVSCWKYIEMNKEAYKEYVLRTPTFYSKVKFDETLNRVKYFKRDIFEDDLSNCLSKLFEEEEQPTFEND